MLTCGTMTRGPTVGLIGFGHFGEALAGRLREADVVVQAWDADRVPPDELAVPNAEAAVAGAEYVVLAVPVAALEGALTDLRPSLTGDQLVMDVGSVKTGPREVMERLLGGEIPWLPTHPLFGPTSLALGDSPLRVVACPDPRHPGALEKARQLYRRIDCDVVEQDAQDHDRIMAQGHALAYFVAKGFMDSGVDLDSPLSPPSVRAIVRTVQAVREDSAHLFASLHRENPFAATARQRLLDALHRVDDALKAPRSLEEQAHHETGALHLDQLDVPPKDLLAARDVIDEIDTELLHLLARRAQVSLRAARAKREVGRGVRDPDREAELLRSRQEQAEELGLDPASVGEVFAALLALSRRHQQKEAP